MDTQKKNRKLAEFAGIRTGPLGGSPDFYHDPSACFRWLLPEARRRLSELNFVQMMNDWLCKVLDREEPTQALCEAILQLIEGGQASWEETIIKTTVHNCHNTLDERLTEQARHSWSLAKAEGEKKGKLEAEDEDIHSSM